MRSFVLLQRILEDLGFVRSIGRLLVVVLLLGLVRAMPYIRVAVYLGLGRLVLGI